MEIPNNSKNEFIMDFQKFAQTKKGLMYNEEKVFIKGTFKGKKTNEIVSGDDFWANKVYESGKKISPELIYKTYLEWFNYTQHLGEEEREFVKAEFGEEETAQ